MTRPAANFNVISLTRVNQWPTSGHHLSSLITGKHVCCGPASVTFDTYWLAGVVFVSTLRRQSICCRSTRNLCGCPFFLSVCHFIDILEVGPFGGPGYFFVVGWLGTGSSILLAQLCTENGSLRARFRRSQIEQMGY